MGQAKLRGTVEERTSLAIQRRTEEQALKEAQRAASARLMRAAYRNGKSPLTVLSLATAMFATEMFATTFGEKQK